VLDPDREGGQRTLDVHMSRLRKKLGTAAAVLATVWGVGYRLEAPPR
jgi:two-component system response regulator MtrA